MYRLEPNQCLNVEPWKTEFSYRIQELERYHVEGFKNVVYLAEVGDQSTFRYRAYNMCHALYGSDRWRGTCFYSGELLNLSKRLNHIDLIILVRYGWTLELDYFVHLSRIYNIPMVFDIDDYVFDPQMVRFVLEAQGVKSPRQEDLDLWHTITTGMQRSALLCDTYITTTDVLADLLKKTFQKDCYVLENGFNRWQEQISESCYQQKKSGKGKSGEILMGYFSGSHTHREDFKVAMDEVKELFCLFSDLKLRIVGYMQLDSDMDEWIKKGRIEFFPYQNFVELQRLIAEVDINLIPLVDNIFTNGKSELKYFEAGICGTISCASPRYVYKNVIDDGVNGYLCDRGEWFYTIYRLCKHGIDWLVAEKARETSIKRYAYYNQRAGIEKVLDMIWAKG